MDGEPLWLTEMRGQALERFAHFPEPAFRYGLDIRMEPIQLALPEPGAGPMPEPARGRIRSRADTARSRSVLLTDLRTALRDHEPLLHEHLLTLLPVTDQFTALHAARWSNGWLLLIPPNTAVSEPLVLPHAASGPSAIEHTIIIAGEHSSASVLQPISAEPADAGLVYRSLATEVFLQPGARLSLASLQTLPASGFAFTAQRAHLAADAELAWATADLGGATTLADLTVTLAGRGARLCTNQALFGSGTQLFNTSLNVIHDAPDTSCDLRSRGALMDAAKAIYRGLIKIRSTGGRANGTQRADVLLLSPDAEADPVPALEIDTNDVRCSHSTSVGRLDPDKLFYLLSRGLDEASARQLLVRGFFSPLLGQLKTLPADAGNGVRERIAGLLEEKIRMVQ